jgi:hypothetical protein
MPPPPPPAPPGVAFGQQLIGLPLLDCPDGMHAQVGATIVVLIMPEQHVVVVPSPPFATHVHLLIPSMMPVQQFAAAPLSAMPFGTHAQLPAIAKPEQQSDCIAALPFATHAQTPAFADPEQQFIWLPLSAVPFGAHAQLPVPSAVPEQHAAVLPSSDLPFATHEQVPLGALPLQQFEALPMSLTPPARHVIAASGPASWATSAGASRGASAGASRGASGCASSGASGGASVAAS